MGRIPISPSYTSGQRILLSRFYELLYLNMLVFFRCHCIFIWNQGFNNMRSCRQSGVGTPNRSRFRGEVRQMVRSHFAQSEKVSARQGIFYHFTDFGDYDAGHRSGIKTMSAIKEITLSVVLKILIAAIYQSIAQTKICLHVVRRFSIRTDYSKFRVKLSRFDKF